MNLLQICHWFRQWKNFENLLTFAEVMDKCLVSCFFLTHSVYKPFSYTTGMIRRRRVVRGRRRRTMLLIIPVVYEYLWVWATCTCLPVRGRYDQEDRPWSAATSALTTGSGEDARHDLSRCWARSCRFQPLCKIRNYFGEKIALYFAWSGTLIISLWPPMLFGFAVFLYGLYLR